MVSISNDFKEFIIHHNINQNADRVDNNEFSEDYLNAVYDTGNIMVQFGSIGVVGSIPYELFNRLAEDSNVARYHYTDCEWLFPITIASINIHTLGIQLRNYEYHEIMEINLDNED